MMKYISWDSSVVFPVGLNLNFCRFSIISFLLGTGEGSFCIYMTNSYPYLLIHLPKTAWKHPWKLNWKNLCLYTHNTICIGVLWSFITVTYGTIYYRISYFRSGATKRLIKISHSLLMLSRILMNEGLQQRKLLKSNAEK